MKNEFFFPPYMGELYGKVEGAFGEKRVLALGHSHYCDDGYNPDLLNLRLHKNRRIIRCDKNCSNYGSILCPNRSGQWTTDAALNYIKTHEETEKSDPKNSQTGEIDRTHIFPNFAHILNKDEGDGVKCWKSLAQYNFLQAAVGKPNREGNSAEIEFSRILVAKAFKELAPDIIIAWSEQKVFNHVFKFLPPEFMWTPGKSDFPCGTIRIGNKTAKVIGIYHPSLMSKHIHEISTNRIKTIAPELFE